MISYNQWCYMLVESMVAWLCQDKWRCLLYCSLLMGEERLIANWTGTGATRTYQSVRVEYEKNQDIKAIVDIFCLFCAKVQNSFLSCFLAMFTSLFSLFLYVTWLLSCTLHPFYLLLYSTKNDERFKKKCSKRKNLSSWDALF